MYSPAKRRLAILTFVCIPLLASSACGSDGESAATPIPEVITVEGEVTFGDGSFNLPQPESGLADLASYKAELTVTFDGTRAGQPSAWSRIYTMLWNKEPAARQLTIEQSGDLPELEQIFMAEAGGVAYERRGENICAAQLLADGPGLSELWEPAAFLPGVIGADAAGTDRVNDIAADHYTFDELALGESPYADATGEVWVASDGGYVVRYLLTIGGTDTYFGEEDLEGKLSFAYELTEVDQVPPLELPEDCPPGLVDAPLLPDAANIRNLPGVLSFETATNLTASAAFYQQKLPELGWSAGNSAINDASVLLNFSQGENTMDVIISADGEMTLVQILIGGR